MPSILTKNCIADVILLEPVVFVCGMDQFIEDEAVPN